ncbi:hypothetical protein HK100_005790, partial [Physocladia obscura]
MNISYPTHKKRDSAAAYLDSFNALVAERIFPGYKSPKKVVVPYHLATISNRGAIGYEISSNAYFQILLYFNMLLFPLWVVGMIVSIRWK